MFGGYDGSSVSSATEEWTSSSTFTKKNLGQVYYNSGSNAFKVTQTVFGTGAWSSGGNLNQARSQGGNNASGGSASIGLVSGGNKYSPGASYDNTEIYNGTAWTEVNNINTTRGYSTGAGTPAGALVVSGNTAPATTRAQVESWDGTNWTETTDVNQGRTQGAGAGTQTSAIFVGGEGGSPWNDNKNKTELWNGSSWTEVNNLNEGRTILAGGGSSTSALVAGGNPGSSPYATVNVRNGANAAASANTAVLIFGGANFIPSATYYAITESWNGTSWTEVADLATARYNGTSAGSSTSAWLAGGFPGSNPQPAITEEWTVPATATNKTITVG